GRGVPPRERRREPVAQLREWRVRAAGRGGAGPRARPPHPPGPPPEPPQTGAELPRPPPRGPSRNGEERTGGGRGGWGGGAALPLGASGARLLVPCPPRRRRHLPNPVPAEPPTRPRRTRCTCEARWVRVRVGGDETPVGGARTHRQAVPGIRRAEHRRVDAR